MPTAEEMAAAGFAPEDFEADIVEVWPEHWDAVRFFLRLPTQWRYGMSGRPGLDYPAVMSLLAPMRLPQAKADEILESVQVMEMAALEAMSKK